MDRSANPGSIPNRAIGNQRFFGSTGRQNTPMQANGAGGFNRGAETSNSNVSRGPAFGRTFSPPASSSQSSRPGWSTFSGRPGQAPSSGGRTFEGQGAPQARPGYPQSSGAARPYQGQGNSRPSFNGGGYSRPTLNMQQPIVTPRGGGSYSGRAPSGGGSRGGSRGGAPAGGHSGHH